LLVFFFFFHRITISGRFYFNTGTDASSFGGAEAESQVEQLVCTRLSFGRSAEPEPIAGFGIIPPKMFILLPPSDGYKMCVRRYGSIWRFSFDDAVGSGMIVTADDGPGGQEDRDGRANVSSFQRIFENLVSVSLTIDTETADFPYPPFLISSSSCAVH
jgi:hypothetical protein